MRLALKLLGWIVVLLLSMLIKVLLVVLCVSAMGLCFFSIGMVILGVFAFLRHAVINGCMLLILAFLISPYGLPMAAAWSLGKLDSVRFLIRNKI